MIAMDQVLSLIGVDEEPSDAQNAGRKTRMTLKEFMLSDSQRAQVEQIDWEKDITAQEKWQFVAHYIGKLLLLACYGVLVVGL
jgi:hypothetical protein